jgi:hypothetical protein
VASGKDVLSHLGGNISRAENMRTLWISSALRLAVVCAGHDGNFFWVAILCVFMRRVLHVRACRVSLLLLPGTKGSEDGCDNMAEYVRINRMPYVLLLLCQVLCQAVHEGCLGVTAALPTFWDILMKMKMKMKFYSLQIYRFYRNGIKAVRAPQ